MTAAPPRATALHLAIVFVTPFMLAVAGCTGEKGAASAALASRSTLDRIDQESAGEIVIPVPAARYTAESVASPGTISGTVTLASPLQPLAPTPAGRDSAVCGAAIPDSTLERRGAGLGDVVVWIEGIRRGKALPLERRLELESDRCLLTPRVQGTVVGSAVNVIGHDDFRQHLRFIAGGDSAARAAILLSRNEQVIPTNLPTDKSGMVVVRDVDHPWVRGYLAVFDHPYFAVTKPDGSFTIDGVPPGKHTLVAWHERTGRVVGRMVDVGAGAAVKVDLALEARQVSR